MPQGEQCQPLHAPLLILEAVGKILLRRSNGLFFARRRLFPKAYIALLISNAVFILLDELAGNQIPFVAQQSKATGARDVFRTWLSALIWCCYVLKSRRVRLTFTR